MVFPFYRTPNKAIHRDHIARVPGSLPVRETKSIL